MHTQVEVMPPPRVSFLFSLKGKNKEEIKEHEKKVRVIQSQTFRRSQLSAALPETTHGHAQP